MRPGPIWLAGSAASTASAPSVPTQPYTRGRRKARKEHVHVQERAAGAALPGCGWHLFCAATPGGARAGRRQEQGAAQRSAAAHPGREGGGPAQVGGHRGGAVQRQAQVERVCRLRGGAGACPSQVGRIARASSLRGCDPHAGQLDPARQGQSSGSLQVACWPNSGPLCGTAPCRFAAATAAHLRCACAACRGGSAPRAPRPRPPSPAACPRPAVQSRAAEGWCWQPSALPCRLLCTPSARAGILPTSCIRWVCCASGGCAAEPNMKRALCGGAARKPGKWVLSRQVVDGPAQQQLHSGMRHAGIAGSTHRSPAVA